MAEAAVVKSADRALRLLELFDAHPDGLTLSEVCAITGWPKSSTVGLLRTMEHRRFLGSSVRGGRYRLGPRVASIGLSYVAGLDVVRQGADVVRDVSRACDETVHLAILKGTNVLYVAKEEGGGHMRMISMVGRSIPAHGTGVGKMLLASLPSDAFDHIYPPGMTLPALTDQTVTDRAAFLHELARIRAQGYATDYSESTIGVCCFAAPVLDHHGDTIAAMSVSVPEPRFTPKRQPELLRNIMQGVRELSVRMGFPPDRISIARYKDEREVSLGAR